MRNSPSLLSLLAFLFLVGCAGTAQPTDLRARESGYRERLRTLPEPTTRDHLRRAFPRMKHVSPPRGPESDSVLTGAEQYLVDADFALEVKYMYAAPFRIAAGATRLGAQAAADEGPSAWQIFGFVRDTVKGPWAESPQDEVLSTRLRRVYRR